MQLSLQDFATMVKTQAAAATASCTQLIDVSIGSVLRALLEANASIGLWMQWLIVQVLTTTRASTSVGSDLDTWVADFGMTRLPASLSTGQLTFSRATTGFAATIPVGALARTGTGVNDQVFVVSADVSNAAWTGSGYQVSSTSLSVTVPAAAQIAGVQANVVAGSINVLATAIPGIDSVTNAGPMAGGLDAEADTALRSRFAGYLDSRNRATAQAVSNAIQSVQQGLSFTIADRMDASGAVRAGHFTVTVDDGSGTPPAALIAKVASVVDTVRPVGGTFSIRPPLVIPVSLQLHVTGAATALVNVSTAIQGYVAGLPIGAALALTKLYQVAYSADSSVTNVTGVMANGAAVDITPPIYGLIRPSSVVVLP